MAPRHLPFFEEHSEPVARRVAAGLHKVGLAMKQEAWHQASEEGLSATQGQILAVLVANEPLTGTELGERLGLTLPTISESVRVLVEKGLVRKTPDPRHPRASLIAPTTKGNAIGTRARAWPEFLVDAVETLSEAEQTTFLTAIMKMIRSLQERGQIPVNRMCVTCSHFRPHVHAGRTPHHCAFVDAPMADVHLRLDCPEHALGSEAQRRELWATFTRAG